MVSATEKFSIQLLRNWSTGRLRYSYYSNGLKIKNWFIRKLGPGVYLMEANKGALALVYDLKKRYPFNVEIYIVENYNEKQTSEDVKEEVEKCRKIGANLKKEKLLELGKTKIRCTINLREVQSK